MGELETTAQGIQATLTSELIQHSLIAVINHDNHIIANAGDVMKIQDTMVQSDLRPFILILSCILRVAIIDRILIYFQHKYPCIFRPP